MPRLRAQSAAVRPLLLRLAAEPGALAAERATLMNLLSKRDVFAENKLFATLDTTTRRVDLPSGQGLLLTDTVGFVRNLPHRLIEAFKATLEEAVLSDFLIPGVATAQRGRSVTSSMVSAASWTGSSASRRRVPVSRACRDRDVATGAPPVSRGHRLRRR